ncbi:hypothetical protein JOD07_002711 [Defluviitalea raffinosedens]|jgi:hypothetical protein|nr:hypothetical protein [Defluviitalea raffinosedens]
MYKILKVNKVFRNGSKTELLFYILIFLAISYNK